ncbi:hypothetical protein [Mesorhizobium sp. M9A.F.Ca.ET.002.03.1.2]|uniref:hypothetical protein n=1 Tax=Mesorhizobium sp. M9A.F.Ca.ET.002.03.1.2 TaxID=2493668 RepID=UPI001FDF9B90|nr:hypothetical protein [Mesorhizobium sp. M9A.F.Ca.ET.002.03.1.2]
MVENSKDAARARADLRFKKQEEAATVRQKAMAEYVAESDARQIKTNKLRALRLAKEAEDLANAPAVPAKKPARAKKNRAGSLRMTLETRNRCPERIMRCFRL